MMLHQDGSRHCCIPSFESALDLIITLDMQRARSTRAFWLRRKGRSRRSSGRCERVFRTLQDRLSKELVWQRSSRSRRRTTSMGTLHRALNRANIAFRKNDTAFLVVDNVEALQAAADKLSPAIIRERLDYWTFRSSPTRSARRSISRASIRSRRSNTAATSS
jgi:hypothetical protein